MPLLYRLRKSQHTSVKVILTLFTSAWLALALQPCAMAFGLPDQQNPHIEQTVTAAKAPHEHCQQGAKAPDVQPPHTCPHCFADLDIDMCQADDWADGKQTLQGFLDSKPVVADRLVTTIPMGSFLPAHLGMEFEYTVFTLSREITPTTLHDISRC